MTYLYWWRDDPKRELKIDVEWTIERFRRKFQEEPQTLLINTSELENFIALKTKLIIKPDHKMPSGYFGLVL